MLNVCADVLVMLVKAKHFWPSPHYLNPGPRCKARPRHTTSLTVSCDSSTEDSKNYFITFHMPSSKMWWPPP